ncbi:helicase-related protein [Paenibacillus larvae]|uniref:helicase-related protein n=1 Tax=Paenibacillus larvae TaxID=1464 RepID=UPI0028539BA7|nr:helicase-related protein [Paenibacillus larvae]MDR5599270.1 helicase-related protein [Paenibacillus larvae]
MKAKLYAVETAASCRWYVTLDEQVDAAYWFRQYGDLTVLRLLEPSLSFGQASALLPVLQQELPAISALLPPKRASHGKAFPELPNARMIPSSTLIDSNTLTSRLFHLIQSAAKTCHLASCRPGQFRFHNVTFARWANQDNEVPFLSQDVYTRIVRAWEGRALLPEEAEQLVQTVHGKGVLDGCSPGLPKNRTSSVSWCSYIQLAWLQGDLAWASGLEAAERRSLPHFWKAERQYTCRRCGSGKDKLVWTSCPYCRTKCPYCSECLGMGRVRFCSPLIYGGKQSSVTSGAKLTGAGVTPEDKGSGTKGDWKLSEAQSAASAEAVRFLDRRRKNTADRQPDRFLIWAVTGAGKTEMIFPLIAHELARGGRVLIATPRRDVVLELAPRIAKAFAGVELAVLYGGSTDRWERGALTIATTHQLLRFTQAFDLVVIDELDAFPYHKNPVPLLLAAPPLRSMLATHKLSAPLVKKLEASLKRGAQVFVFVPNIRSVEPLVHLLRQVLGPLHGGRGGTNTRKCPVPWIQGTSSKDPHRTEKVRDFRDGATRVLMTTTILERGVTVPRTDAFILDADSRLFDAAALVQMSGRVGRSKDDPAGTVCFVAKEKTSSQKEAIRQIAMMNAQAKKQGYLIDKGGRT